MENKTNNTYNEFFNDTLPRIISIRKAALEKIIKEKQRSLKDTPEGHLRICCRKGHAEYYWRKTSKDNNGDYLPKGKRELAAKLAQKEYDKKLLSLAKKELRLSSAYLEHITGSPIPAVYDKLPAARKELVAPVSTPDDEYKRLWLSESYEPMGFDNDAAEYYTDNGIRVRSKSEIIIAGMLEKHDIPYKYEYPLQLSGKGTVRPDFLCLNVRTRKEYIWEHFGMMDNEEYAIKNVAKINSYSENGYFPGINMIMTFEASHIPVSSGVIKAMIKQFLL